VHIIYQKDTCLAWQQQWSLTSSTSIWKCSKKAFCWLPSKYWIIKTTRWSINVLKTAKNKSVTSAFWSGAYIRTCVSVIGDFNTHSHVSVNDCQLNMNDIVFFLTAQYEGKKKKFAVQFLSWTDRVNLIGLFDIRFMSWLVICQRVKVNRREKKIDKYGKNMLTDCQRISIGHSIFFLHSFVKEHHERRIEIGSHGIKQWRRSWTQYLWWW
jgi:hypothetical protein